MSHATELEMPKDVYQLRHQPLHFSSGTTIAIHKQQLWPGLNSCKCEEWGLAMP